ncbi:hypothetical protein DICVIV_06653 [Dictyocaulus viviparus]|uniref:Uncharacterized protein n=1 Tax=Dictyocaulus viviparus TaxID=29172 RepID=A0A0D8XTW6_DICVI|nr:hypothetical protein DICVIV_06653 [Dictyocaulus viviparus]
MGRKRYWMDVMDLIKLASAEDSDRRKSSVEDSSCVLDSGDASSSNSIMSSDIAVAENALRAYVKHLSLIFLAEIHASVLRRFLSDEADSATVNISLMCKISSDDHQYYTVNVISRAREGVLPPARREKFSCSIFSLYLSYSYNFPDFFVLL